jgi:hypothetical protein
MNFCEKTLSAPIQVSVYLLHIFQKEYEKKDDLSSEMIYRMKLLPDGLVVVSIYTDELHLCVEKSVSTKSFLSIKDAIQYVLSKIREDRVDCNASLIKLNVSIEKRVRGESIGWDFDSKRCLLTVDENLIALAEKEDVCRDADSFENSIQTYLKEMFVHAEKERQNPSTHLLQCYTSARATKLNVKVYTLNK